MSEFSGAWNGLGAPRPMTPEEFACAQARGEITAMSSYGDRFGVPEVMPDGSPVLSRLDELVELQRSGARSTRSILEELGIDYDLAVATLQA